MQQIDMDTMRAAAASLHRRHRVLKLLKRMEDQIPIQTAHIEELEQALPEARNDLATLEGNVRALRTILSEVEA